MAVAVVHPFEVVHVHQQDARLGAQVGQAGVGDGHSQSHPPDHSEVRQVIPKKSNFFHLISLLLPGVFQCFLQCGEFVFPPLNNELDAQFRCTSCQQFRRSSRNNAHLDTIALQKFNAQPILNIKRF